MHSLQKYLERKDGRMKTLASKTCRRTRGNRGWARFLGCSDWFRTRNNKHGHLKQKRDCSARRGRRKKGDNRGGGGRTAFVRVKPLKSQNYELYYTRGRRGRGKTRQLKNMKETTQRVRKFNRKGTENAAAQRVARAQCKTSFKK